MKINKIKSLGRGRLYPFLLMLSLFWLSATAIAARADWTILVYMAADNGLSQFAIQDINQMESATIPSGTNVIVQADFSDITNPSDGHRYKIRHDDNTDLIQSQVLANLGDFDSGDWHNLNSFAKWGFDKYPAEHKALIVWSHADSWYKGANPKWICTDNEAENLMSVSGGDLRNVLNGIPALDVLLFDACSMQTLEVLSEVMDKTEYVVGSEDLVPSTGFPYQDILPVWQGEAETLVTKLPELYVNSYAPYGSQNPEGIIVKVTCSAFKTAGLPDFINDLGIFAGNTDTKYRDIRLARTNSYNLNTYDAEADIKELLTNITTSSTDTNLIASAQDKLSSLSNLVVASAAINYEVELGVAAVWFPVVNNTFINWWQRYIKLTNMHSWLNLVYFTYEDAIVPLPEPEIVSAYNIFDRLELEFNLQPYPDNQQVWTRFVSDETTGSFGPVLLDDSEYFVSLEQNIHKSLFDTNHNGWFYLWVTDSRGNVSSEDSVYVELKKARSKLMIYPNPAGAGQQITFEWLASNTASEKANQIKEISIYDIKGRDLQLKPVGVHNQDNDHFVCTINSNLLASGVYIAVAKTSGKSLKAKFTIIH